VIYLGIDPGASGGIAVLGMEGGPRAWKMAATEADLYLGLVDTVAEHWQAGGDESPFAIIEHVHSMPKQGVASSFKFGMSYGGLRMALIAAGIPFEAVSPQKWQKAMGCLSKGDKNVTKRKAQELFPSLKVTHATADALLLAEYGRRFHGK